MIFFCNFVANCKIFIMKRGTKIALIALGVITLGVGAYVIWDRSRYKSGNPTKDDRKIVFKR